MAAQKWHVRTSVVAAFEDEGGDVSIDQEKTHELSVRLPRYAAAARK